MPSLDQVYKAKFSDFTTEDGLPFRGHIFAAPEGSFVEYDWARERLILRTDPDSPLKASDEFVDHFGRRFLVAEHGSSILKNVRLYKAWRLVELNTQMDWTRTQTQLDPLTGEPRFNSEQSLGTIWVTKEPSGGTALGAIKIHADEYRVLTGKDVKIDDNLDGMVVKRVDTVLGVKLVELQ